MTLVSVLTKAAHPKLDLGQDFSRDAWFCPKSLLVILLLELSFLYTGARETLSEKTAVKNSSVSASSLLAATNLPSPFSTGPFFPCLFLYC